MANKIKSLFLDLGIIDEDSIIKYYHKVRDRDDITVLKCNKSGVIFLSSSEHINILHYENKNNFEYWNANDRNNAILSNHEDDLRRYNQF